MAAPTLSRSGSVASHTSRHSNTSATSGTPNISTALNGTSGLRPSDLTAGRNLTVTTNLLLITQTPKVFFQYTIEFGKKVRNHARPGEVVREPEITRREEKRKVLKVLLSHPAFKRFPFAISHNCDLLWTLEGVNGFRGGIMRIENVPYTRPDGVSETLKDLTFRRDKIISFDDSIKPTDVLGTRQAPKNCIELTAMLNAFVTRSAMFNEEFIQVGANRFFVKNETPFKNTIILGTNGYNVSTRAIESGIGITVNYTVTCFLRPIKLSVLLRTLQQNRIVELSQLKAILRGLKVEVNFKRGILEQGTPRERDGDTLQNIVKSIGAFGKSTGTQRYYQDANDLQGRTVVSYFQTTYPGVRLTELEMPCVNVGKDNPANRHLAIWYPPECLDILPDQKAHHHVQQLFVADIITHAARPANVNRDDIQKKAILKLGLAGPRCVVQDFDGFEISPNLLNIPGKILEAPAVFYRRGTKHTITQEASWNLNSVTRFIRNVEIQELPILVLTRSSKSLAIQRVRDWNEKIFGTELTRYGFRVPTHKRVISAMPLSTAGSEDTLKERLEDARNKDIRLVVIVNELLDKDSFAQIKRLGDLQYGVATLCMFYGKSLEKRDDLQYVANNILKMNQKLGGINHISQPIGLSAAVGQNLKNTIVMGADVVHQGTQPGRLGCPSIACVTGAVDADFTKYLPSMRLQRGLQERIRDIGPMVQERIRAWIKANNGGVPASILFYRDGVSDSQYENICGVEIEDIYRAFSAMPETKNNTLKLTYAFVSKRHSTRFYPTERKFPPMHLSKHGNNVKAGLCVDKSVTHPYRFDFYLQAHAAIKGTARPAHYFVMRNEMKLDANNMIALTHSLSYALGRATKGISYVAPAFCADRALDYAAKWWFRFGHLKDTPVKSSGEDRDDFMRRCLQYALLHNPPWRCIGRPGPWHENLDDVMMYA